MATHGRLRVARLRIKSRDQLAKVLRDRASGRIDHNAITVPRMIFKSSNGFPGRKDEARDVRVATLDSPPVLRRIRANYFDLNDLGPRFISRGTPGVASLPNGIHRICHDGPTSAEVVTRHCVADAVADVTNLIDWSIRGSDGMLNRIDPKVNSTQRFGQATGERCLPRTWQTCKDDEHCSPLTVTTHHICEELGCLL
jgi:hypothetical protein